MKITRIQIKNYRGIVDLDASLPSKGAVAKGKNGGGKTTILRAIQAALLAQDVKPDAIRIGAEKAEILIDLDDHEIRRVITAAGQRLEVTRDGMSPKAPQGYLTSLLGTSSLDPLDLLTLKGKERRTRVLSALPATVTVEQLRRWWPGCPPDYDCSGHGLEVIAAVRCSQYASRTEANRKAKEAEQTAKLARERAATMPEVDLEEAQRASLAIASQVDDARRALEALRTRKAAAAQQESKVQGIRSEIAKYREQADLLQTVSKNELEVNYQTAKEDEAIARKVVDQLTAELAKARVILEERESSRKAIAKQLDQCETGESYRRHAHDLEASIKAMAIEGVSPEEEDAAQKALLAAEDKMQQAAVAALNAGAAKEAHEAARELAKEAEQAKQAAKALDDTVKALDAAPAELLAACEGIPGLTLEGDEILLDGVRLDALCGAEQVRFCVEIARRANAKSRILVVDGLERLDPEQLDVFVREATRDDWQLIATRVDRGEVVLEGIEL